MIIDENIDRFASNFGVQPTSISLLNNWTTPFDAQSVELAGRDFSRETDFGYGLGGLGNFFDWVDSIRFGDDQGSTTASRMSARTFVPEQRSTKQWGTPSGQTVTTIAAPVMAHPPVDVAMTRAQQLSQVSNNPQTYQPAPTAPSVRSVNWTEIGYGYGPDSKIQFVRNRPIMGAHVTSPLHGIEGGMEGLGFEETFANAADAATTVGDGDILSKLHTVFDASSFVVWPIALFGMWTLYKGLKSGTTKRRKAIGRAKTQLAQAKKTSYWG